MRLSLFAFYTVAFVLLIITPTTYADWLKVDISVFGQSGGAPGFTSWDVVNATTDTQTTTIGGLTFTVKMISPTLDSSHYLSAAYANKDGKTYNFKLSYDGFWPRWKDNASIDMPYPNGGAMTLTIAGLSTGPHNIVTYHNDPWTTTMTWTAGGISYPNAVSDCNVAVDGVYVKTVTPTTNNRNDATCGYAFFTVNAVAGTPVVISMTPAHNRTMDNVFLNGFEIDAPGEPSALANTPVPADADLHANCNNDDPAAGHVSDGYTTLSWTPSAFAIAHGIYFGTDQTAITNATTASTGLYFGTQTATTYPVTNLTSRLTYYWRIDEINVSNVTTKGAVWSFRPRRVAFPGAEGYGRFAHAGRYGRVVEVTNLNDSGVGSLRQAMVVEKGPRVIVFRVSGTILLNSKIILPNDGGDVYIAGQTAPGDGICVARYNCGSLGASDVIYRFIRCRVGEYGLAAIDGIGLASCDHCIIDHCSISWTLDEAHSSRSAKNITFQRNLIAEPLNDSYHYNDADPNHLGTQPHAFGASISGNKGSYHHNLLMHCTRRTWSLAGGLEADGRHYAGYLDIRNNVVYNWQSMNTDGGVKNLDFINNYYKPGPVSTWTNLMYFGGDELSLGDWQQCYVTGNKYVGKPQWDTDNWLGVLVEFGTQAQVRVNTPFFADDLLTTETADQAYADVPNDVGATQPRQDRNDARSIREILGSTYTFKGSRSSSNLPGIIDSQDDAGGYPSLIYRTYNVPTDTDHDGLPDWWETMKGLNPNSPAGDFSDSNGDPDSDGYTNLDDYLSYLADGGSQLGNWKCTKSLLADLNGDCQVDFRDFAQFTATWGTMPSVSDLANDNVLNFKDVMLFSNDWLTCNRAPSEECWQ